MVLEMWRERAWHQQVMFKLFKGVVAHALEVEVDDS